MSIIASNSHKTSTSPFTGSTASSYTLQLEGGRTVEIGSQPVMIGSGPRCVYRVGTKPVHCVVSLGAEGPVVRRWAEETLLNGESFTEALLSDGDCLSIGSDHFEVHCQGEVDQLEELLEELETLEIEEQEETQETVANETVEEADESVTEDHSEVGDWLGGQSEWVTSSETSSVEQEVDEAVIKTETENTDTHDEPQEEEYPWAIESTSVEELSVEELPVEELAGTDEPSLPEEIVALVDESEHEETNTGETGWLDFFTEEEASTVDELEATGPDLADAASPFDAADTLTIVALRARLAIRAERLRSVVETLRSERTQTEQQSAESLGRIEQLQTDLANAQHQVSEGVVSFATLQEELAAASERIETLEAELRDAIEASTIAAEEETAKIEEPLDGEGSSEEEEPAVESSVVEEASIWPEPTDVTENETEPSTFEQFNDSESNSEPVNAEVPAAVEPNAAEKQLWGIESLVPGTTTLEETPVEELTLNGESHCDTVAEEVVEEPIEEIGKQPAEELSGSLDDVLLPGETLEYPTSEPIDELYEDGNSEAIVANADNDGNSVLASLMTPLSSETQETTEQASEYVEQESFIDRFAHELPEETAEEMQNDSIETPLPASLVPDETPAETEEQVGGEESIDDYMKKMMGRIRGDEAPAPVAPKTSRPVQVKVAPQSAAAEKEGVAPEPKQTPLLNLDEMKRNPTRALGADLSELRQLANQSARRAIDVSETKDRKEHATTRLVVSGVVATCGLLACLTTPSLLSWQLYGGLAGIMAGGYLGFRTVKVIQHSASLEAMPLDVVEDSEV